MRPPEVISGRNVAEIMYSEQIVPKRDLLTVPPDRNLVAEELLLGSSARVDNSSKMAGKT